MNRQVMDKVARGVAKLAEQFAGSARLDGGAKKNLAGLGYEF